MRRRYVLWCALGLLLALYGYGSLFIWDFQVTGNDTVPTEKILRALEHNGVAIGTRSLSFDQEELRNHVLLELGDISWLSVNVKGCTAHVQVVERRRPPEIVDRSRPANVVAARDGLVTKLEALDGRALVAAGAVVTRGQLLISGVSDSHSDGVRFMRGSGRVYARTWYTLSVLVPLTTAEKTGEGETARRVALDVGKQRYSSSLYPNMNRNCPYPLSCTPFPRCSPPDIPFRFRFSTHTASYLSASSLLSLCWKSFLWFFIFS